MSKAARKFVDQWISENADATDGNAEADVVMANKLALKCLAAADRAGISATAIESDCGDLAAYVDEAISRANSAGRTMKRPNG